MNATIQSREVTIEIDDVALAASLAIPAAPQGIVIFAHGSGSSRHSPRNRAVALILQEAGCATLLADLLTEHEARDRANVFDIALLAGRVADVTRWCRGAAIAGIDLPIGYFGASTGGAAALVAAAEPGSNVRAVVSRGGRPDLARHALPAVTSPTLLVVGSRDHDVLELNRSAQRLLRCENRLAIIEGATHLFEEPGTLEQAAEEARAWFAHHFSSR